MTKQETPNKVESNLLCPVCKKIMDTVRYNPLYKGMVLASLGDDGRAEHARKSPACVKHDDWFKGWIEQRVN